MTRTLTAALAIAAALLLAGCSSPAADETQLTRTSTESPAEPLTAETPTAPAVSEADAAFLAAVRKAQEEFQTQIPNATDEQLLEAGAKACAALETGTDTSTLSLIDGETPNVGGYYNDSAAIITAAHLTLCPA